VVVGENLRWRGLLGLQALDMSGASTGTARKSSGS
jgi:hypothetical protein